MSGTNTHCANLLLEEYARESVSVLVMTCCKEICEKFYVTELLVANIPVHIDVLDSGKWCYGC